MAIQVSWLIKDRILHWHMSGAANPADIRAAEAVSLHMMENVRTRVHFMFDVKELTDIPPLVAYSRQKWTLPTDSRFGWSFIVGMRKASHRTSMSVLANLFRMRIRFVDTESDALDLLRCIDRSFAELECRAF